MTIGENIRHIRELKGMTQQELADSIGISRSYLGDLEKNRRNPSTETIEKLSNLLGVSIFYIMKGMKTKQDELFFSNIKNEDFIDSFLNKRPEDIKEKVSNLEISSRNKQLFNLINTLLSLDQTLSTDYDDTNYKELVEEFFNSIRYFDYFISEYRIIDPKNNNYKSQRLHLKNALNDFLASQAHTEDAAIQLVKKLETE